VWVVSWFDPLLTDKKGRSTGAEKKRVAQLSFRFELFTGEFLWGEGGGSYSNFDDLDSIRQFE